jgi:hypothetical protein
MITDQDQPNDVILHTLLDQQTTITAKTATFDSKLADLHADFDSKRAIVEEERTADVLILARTTRMLAIHRGEEPVTVAGSKTQRTWTKQTDSATAETRKAAKKAAADRFKAKKAAEKAAAAAAQSTVPSPKSSTSRSKSKKAS